MMNEESLLLQHHHPYCNHCFVPFIPYNENEEDPPSSSLTRAMSTIFKLNYLKAFDAVEEEEELLSFCPKCTYLLSNLHQLYNDFVELGKISSYLTRKLDRMDEIMDCHEQRTINCDLIAEQKYCIEKDFSPDSSNDNVHHSSQLSPSTSSKLNALQKRSTIANNNNNSPFSSKPSNSIIFEREPRIILTRLPKHYSPLSNVTPVKLTTAAAAAEDEIDIFDDDNDDDYVPSDEDGVLDNYEHFQESKELASSAQKLKNKETTTDPLSNRSKSSSCKTKKGLPERTTKKTTEKSQPTEITEPERRRKYRERHQNENSPSKSSKKRQETITKEDDDDGEEKRTKEGSKMCRDRIRSCQIFLESYDYYDKRTRYRNLCWYCRKTDFQSPAECFEHTKEEHLPIDDGTFVQLCERCSKLSFNAARWKSHQEKCALIPPGQLLSKTIQCSQCEKLFFSTKKLNSHERNAHSTERPFSCDQCPYRAKRLQVLNYHKTNKHPPLTPEEQRQARIECDECGAFLKNEASWRTHKRYMHAKTTKQKEAYTEVLKRRKLNKRDYYTKRKSKTIECRQCSKFFGSASLLKTHELVHSTERPFSCDQCPYRAKMHRVLLQHKANKHPPPQTSEEQQQARVICDECGACLKNEASWKTHKKYIHAKTPEEKEEYRLVLQRGQLMKREYRKRNQVDRPTVCVDCGIDFYSNLAYRNHRRSFHGEILGEFVCDKCGLTFPSAGHLKGHERAHSDDRPYVCQDCDKAFKTSGDLKSHCRQTHTTEGRLKYNKRIREGRRRRLLLKKQLAERQLQIQTQQNNYSN